MPHINACRNAIFSWSAQLIRWVTRDKQPFMMIQAINKEDTKLKVSQYQFLKENEQVTVDVFVVYAGATLSFMYSLFSSLVLRHALVSLLFSPLLSVFSVSCSSG